MKAMAYKVFISHTQRDNDLAHDLATRLEEVGAKVFSVDKSALPSDKVIRPVNRGLREADEVIVILSSASLTSPGVFSEMGAAFSLDKVMTQIVVGLEDNELPSFVTNSVRYGDVGAYIADMTKRTRRGKTKAA